MIKKYKGIKILDKPAGKLRKNEDKLTPDFIINSKNYYIVKSFASVIEAKKDDYIRYSIYNKYNRYLGSARVYFGEIDDQKNVGNAHIQIIKSYQRKGLATLLYDYIEKDLKIKLRISNSPSKDAKAFWKNRLKLKNPYREKTSIGYNYTNIEYLRSIYNKGYLQGLIDGLNRINLRDWEISKLNFNYYTFDNQNYYKKGYYKGLDDSQEQLKLISKNKLKSYIKELEEEIDNL